MHTEALRHRAAAWRRRRVLCSLMLAAAIPPVFAQQTPPQERVEQPKRWEASVQIRDRVEIRDNADFQPADDFDAFLGHRLRLNLLFRAHPRLSLYVQAQDVWLAGARSDKILHDFSTNLHQAWFEWRLDADGAWQLRGGRQELAYGDERLLGPSNWDNVGRSFDAARLRYAAGDWTADAFWGRLVDVRRNGAPSRPGAQDLSGAYIVHAPGASGARTDLYGLFLRDGLRTAGEVQPTLATSRILTLGFRHVRRPPAGWQYGIENAWQAGYRGPDPHRAVALVATAGYVWNSPRAPRLAFEYDFASGDGNSADGSAREFHSLFPTSHGVLGYADLIGLRNIHAFRATAAARLLSRLGVDFDYHHFLLAARRGPWKNSGGRVLGFDPTGQSGRDIGQELDFTLRLPLFEHLDILAGYSAFFPGRFAIETRGPETHHWGYVQTTIAF